MAASNALLTPSACNREQLAAQAFALADELQRLADSAPRAVEYRPSPAAQQADGHGVAAPGASVLYFAVPVSVPGVIEQSDAGGMIAATVSSRDTSSFSMERPPLDSHPAPFDASSGKPADVRDDFEEPPESSANPCQSGVGVHEICIEMEELRLRRTELDASAGFSKSLIASTTARIGDILHIVEAAEARAKCGKESAEVWLAEKELRLTKGTVLASEWRSRMEAARSRREAAHAASEAVAASVPMDNVDVAGIADVQVDALSGTLSGSQSRVLRADALVENRARLQSELESLRYQVKNVKRLQHRRVQELDAQVKKLEKNRGRLETEKLCLLKGSEAVAEESATAAAAQLLGLRDLNDRLTAQACEADAERITLEIAASSLHVESAKIAMEGKSEAEQIQARQDALDELSTVEAGWRREARELHSRAALLARQVSTLSSSASWAGEQLSEAEAALSRAEAEEQSAARRSEILDWKLQVATTQGSRLSRAHRISSADSDSTAGAAGPDSGSAP